MLPLLGDWARRVTVLNRGRLWKRGGDVEDGHGQADYEEEEEVGEGMEESRHQINQEEGEEEEDGGQGDGDWWREEGICSRATGIFSYFLL